MKPLHPSRIVDFPDYQRILDDTGRWQWFKAKAFRPDDAQPRSKTEAETLGVRDYTRVLPEPADVPPKTRYENAPPRVGDRIDFFGVSEYIDGKERMTRYDARLENEKRNRLLREEYIRYGSLIYDDKYDTMMRGIWGDIGTACTNRERSERQKDGEYQTQKRSPEDMMRIITKLSLVWEKRPKLGIYELFQLAGMKDISRRGVSDRSFEEWLDQELAKP